MKSQRRKEERPQIRLKTPDMCFTYSKSFLLKSPTDEHGWNIANRLCGEMTQQVLQEYLDNVKKFYLATVQSADFVNAAQGSRKIIPWVESQINGKKSKACFPMALLVALPYWCW